MRTFNFTLLAAVLGFVAVIGATPLEARAPAEAIGRRQTYPDCDQEPYDELCKSCEIYSSESECVELCKVNHHLSFCEPESSESSA